MTSDPRTISVSQRVKGTAAELYHALTNPMLMRQWLADEVLSNPLPGGLLFLWWEDGYYANGVWGDMQRDQSLTFSWRGRSETEAGEVRVELVEENGETEVTVTHSGIAGDDTGTPHAEIMRRAWEGSLEALAYSFETGLDLRLVRRPMLGILLGPELTPEVAERLGAPVTEGVLLEGTIEGMGARAAGLQAGDVLVSMAGKPISGYSSFGPALSGRHGGDEVEVEVYRGAEKLTLPMTLSKRPIEEYPATAASLAEALRTTNQEVLGELRDFYGGISEEEASLAPGPGEWSARQVLAHLVANQRAQHVPVALAVRSQRADEWGSNELPYLYATMAANPTIPDLLNALEAEMEFTAAMVEAIPESVVQRKATFRRIAEMLLEDADHMRTHMGQARESLQKARETRAETLEPSSSD